MTYNVATSLNQKASRLIIRKERRHRLYNKRRSANNNVAAYKSYRDTRKSSKKSKHGAAPVNINSVDGINSVDDTADTKDTKDISDDNNDNDNLSYDNGTANNPSPGDSVEDWILSVVAMMILNRIVRKSWKLVNHTHITLMITGINNI